MRTSISKEIHHSLLVEENDLQSLFDFIISKYGNVGIIARCIDGSRLETREIKDIIGFENPNYRKIRTISLRAAKEVQESINLDLWTDRVFTSGELQIDSNQDEQALYVSQEILSRLAEMKPWYEWLARISLSWVLGGLGFLWGMTVTLQQLVGVRPRSTAFQQFSIIEWLYLLALFLIPYVVLISLLERAQKYLFPHVFFLIGRQKRTMESIRTWRQLLFIGLALALVVSVIANGISNLLFR